VRFRDDHETGESNLRKLDPDHDLELFPRRVGFAAYDADRLHAYRFGPPQVRFAPGQVGNKVYALGRRSELLRGVTETRTDVGPFIVVDLGSRGIKAPRWYAWVLVPAAQAARGGYVEEVRRELEGPRMSTQRRNVGSRPK
jgi:hypothetical protein